MVSDELKARIRPKMSPEDLQVFWNNQPKQKHYSLRNLAKRLAKMSPEEFKEYMHKEYPDLY